MLTQSNVPDNAVIIFFERCLNWLVAVQDRHLPYSREQCSYISASLSLS